MAEESAFLSRTRTWDQFYSEPGVAEFRGRIYLEAFGDEYPSKAATDGYITRKELRELADALEVGRVAESPISDVVAEDPASGLQAQPVRSSLGSIFPR